MSLTRSQVRKALKSRRGAITRLADDLGLTPTTVSMVLKGRGTSVRVMAEATARAERMLAAEARVKAAAARIKSKSEAR